MKISSFEKKPESGAMPASARAERMNVPAVTGMRHHSPPSCRASCSPLMWMIEPAPRNSVALKKACVIRCSIAMPTAPAPSATNMKPSWLTVE